MFGKNKIEVKVKSYWRLFVEEVFNPFYLFQAFSVILWYFDEYRIYGACVVVLTTFSIVTALYETRKVFVLYLITHFQSYLQLFLFLSKAKPYTL